MFKIRRYKNSDHDEVWSLHNLALKKVGAHPGNGPWDDDLHHISSVYINRGGEFLVSPTKIRSKILPQKRLHENRSRPIW